MKKRAALVSTMDHVTHVPLRSAHPNATVVSKGVWPLSMGSQVEVCCRATDAASNTQPPSAAPIWNMRGLANNSWHTVAVTMDR